MRLSFKCLVSAFLLASSLTPVMESAMAAADYSAPDDPYQGGGMGTGMDDGTGGTGAGMGGVDAYGNPLPAATGTGMGSVDAYGNPIQPGIPGPGMGMGSVDAYGNPIQPGMPGGTGYAPPGYPAPVPQAPPPPDNTAATLFGVLGQLGTTALTTNAETEQLGIKTEATTTQARDLERMQLDSQKMNIQGGLQQQAMGMGMGGMGMGGGMMGGSGIGMSGGMMGGSGIGMGGGMMGGGGIGVGGGMMGGGGIGAGGGMMGGGSI
ncbi:MAG: hypothetical protein K0R52_514, partial [Alphaproteobacteria bacterium]|nr:hypothetical protein [Alphaproteobacteria bacterium]